MFMKQHADIYVIWGSQGQGCGNKVANSEGSKRAFHNEYVLASMNSVPCIYRQLQASLKFTDRHKSDT